MKIEVIATIEEKVSKSGKEYTVISIPITDSYTMRIFPNDAEKALCQMIMKGDSL